MPFRSRTTLILLPTLILQLLLHDLILLLEFSEEICNVRHAFLLHIIRGLLQESRLVLKLFLLHFSQVVGQFNGIKFLLLAFGLHYFPLLDRLSRVLIPE